MLISELLDHSLELSISSLDLILSPIGTLLEIISDIAHGHPLCDFFFRNAEVGMLFGLGCPFPFAVTFSPRDRLNIARLLQVWPRRHANIQNKAPQGPLSNSPL